MLRADARFARFGGRVHDDQFAGDVAVGDFSESQSETQLPPVSQSS